ncbi:MAG: endoribonuclease MazF [bacterium]|nr:endoribonuclease MazF [bacterium]
MVNPPYIPSRGDIVWVDFDPQRGHEQAGRRPALTVSPQTYNRKAGLALMCPITSKIKDYPFEVSVKQNTIQGAVLADQIQSLDWSERNARFIEKIDAPLLESIQQKLLLLITEG